MPGTRGTRPYEGPEILRCPSQPGESLDVGVSSGLGTLGFLRVLIVLWGSLGFLKAPLGFLGFLQVLYNSLGFLRALQLP